MIVTITPENFTRYALIGASPVSVMRLASGQTLMYDDSLCTMMLFSDQSAFVDAAISAGITSRDTFIDNTVITTFSAQQEAQLT